MSNSGKLELEGTSGSCSSLNSWKSWLHSYSNPKSKSMIYNILRQSDLYHNPGPLFRLVGEVNKTTVIVEGQEARVLIDSGSQLSAISLAWVKKLNLKPQQLQSILQIEGSPKLTHSDWITEQSEDSDISHIVQLLKSDKLKKYVAREMGSSGI